MCMDAMELSQHMEMLEIWEVISAKLVGFPCIYLHAMTHQYSRGFSGFRKADLHYAH